MAKVAEKEVKKAAAPKKVAATKVKEAKTTVKPVKEDVVTASNAVVSKANKNATSDVASSKKAAKISTNAAVSVDVYGIDGKVTGKISLPGAIFGERMNKDLIAQAVRVYLANQRQGNASTKTRGEVDGSTRKIYRQKGTGRARHGGVRAPIFVKGGIAHGPKPRDFGLSLPKKMRRKALFVTLSAKAKDSQIMVLAGTDKLEAKTKVFMQMLTKLGVAEKKQKLLFVTGSTATNEKKAGQNIPGVTFTAVNQLNTYEVLNTKRVIFLKDAVAELEKFFLGKDK